MPNDPRPSPLGPDSAYRDASIYVDAVAAPRVVARIRDLLGLVDHYGAELAVGPVRVEGEPNDYATSRRAHPFDFLQWPTVLECEATDGTPAEEVQAVTTVLEALWRGGFKAVAACDFEDELPTRGGIDRYPLPASGSGSASASASASGGSGASVSSWWRNLISPGKRRNRMS
ncbi:hypothetical protein [Streptomyces sp. CL12-4]|uniref:hypothetical protein n=1 Tax=Streptomyces sp. CL12-4 TaxID=2810306 RepID=UPI001EFB6DCA|nr:hypothetical protein [Streptomyces sp. CL12-4]MCG8970207.1 hypothetical protein [Streptomyces sp. CL12-4]